jgi:hypothetical protein
VVLEVRVCEGEGAQVGLTVSGLGWQEPERD